MDIKAFIFDLDGVIVHTDKLHYKAWKKVADELKIEFNEEINNKLRGISRMESLDIILNHSNIILSDEEKFSIATKKNNYYKELLQDMSKNDVSKEVIDTLNELKKKGYSLAIGSSSKNAKFILKQIELYDMFDAISDGTNIEKSKPDPEVFIKAAAFLNISAQKCCVIEDATAGIDAAKNADMIAIAIGDANGYAKNDYSMNSFKDLLEIEQQLN